MAGLHSHRKTTVCFACVIALVFCSFSIASALFDVKAIYERFAEQGPSFNRTFTFETEDRRMHSIFWKIPREAVEQTVNEFGLESRELEHALEVAAAKFAAENDIEVQVRLKDELSYSFEIRHGGHQDGKRLLSRLQKMLDAAENRYQEAHYLHTEDKKVSVDYASLQLWQAPKIRPLYDMLRAKAQEQQMNDREFTALLTGFVQHMKYEIPPSRQHGRLIVGVWPPIVALKEKAGDCDTKSVLFATLYYHYRKNSTVLIDTPQHAFIGIANQHRVFPKDRVTRIGGKDYLLVEMTQPWEMGKLPADQESLIKSGRFKYLTFN